MSKLFTRFAGWCAWAFGHPLAFILACLATLGWAVTGPVFNYSDTWQLVINTGTTVATFLMIFVCSSTPRIETPRRSRRSSTN